jgi:hypothetical protein
MAAAITAGLIGLFSLHGSEKVLCVLIAVLRLNDIAIQSRCPCKSEITLVLPFGVGENMGTALSVVWRPCRRRSNTSIGASLSGAVGESLRHVDPELRPAAHRPSCRADAVGNETSRVSTLWLTLPRSRGCVAAQPLAGNGRRRQDLTFRLRAALWRERPIAHKRRRSPPGFSLKADRAFAGMRAEPPQRIVASAQVHPHWLEA